MTAVTRGVVAVADLPVDHVTVARHDPAAGDPAAGGATTAAGASGTAVILTHGAGGTLDDPGVVALAGELAAGGHLVVRTNMPYRQVRAKGPPPRAERGAGDLAAVVAAIAAAEPSATRWVVGGKSYGGRLATMLAARVDGSDRVVAAARVPAPVGVLCYSYPLHAPGRPAQVRVEHFPSVAAPVLFLQGTHDPFGGPVEVLAHVGQLGAGAVVVPVEGGDHSLKVPRTRSADGATHAPAAVLATLGDRCRTWLAGL